MLLSGPAAADEVAYLMYVRGSEGPPATPLRVVWDVLGDSAARITIDLGEKYEPALSKLGLGRVLKYDAKPDKTLFVGPRSRIHALRKDDRHLRRAEPVDGELGCRRVGAEA